jgi:hypothetical protein
MLSVNGAITDGRGLILSRDIQFFLLQCLEQLCEPRNLLSGAHFFGC